MSFEHSVDASIKPVLTVRPEPAHGVQSRVQTADASSGREVSSAGESPAVAPDEDFSFYDLLDVINPLQHIPVVSSLYREITGDEIRGPARVLGGLLFGGPVGFVSAVANAVTVESSGRDIGENALAFVFGEDSPVDTSDLADAATPDLQEVGAELAAAPHFLADLADEGGGFGDTLDQREDAARKILAYVSERMTK